MVKNLHIVFKNTGIVQILFPNDLGNPTNFVSENQTKKMNHHVFAN